METEADGQPARGQELTTMSMGTETLVPPDVFLRPVRGANAFEETVERIAQAIKLGGFPPGTRLPAERDLAVRFGVSRVTLRAAIRALQTAGLIESRRGRGGGSFITWQPPRPNTAALRRLARDMGGNELDDALIFRAVVEPGGAEMAARVGLTDEQAELLRERLRATEKASKNGYRQADSRFHLAIAELSGSTTLAAAVADVQMRLDDLLRAIPLLPEAIEHSSAQHSAIVEAVIAGHADDARRHMQEHVAATAALLRGLLS
jgi:GntR family transcriptional regulator, transcriptional repressor for pyruvate dehydrogenase complex